MYKIRRSGVSPILLHGHETYERPFTMVQLFTRSTYFDMEFSDSDVDWPANHWEKYHCLACLYMKKLLADFVV